MARSVRFPWAVRKPLRVSLLASVLIALLSTEGLAVAAPTLAGAQHGTVALAAAPARLLDAQPSIRRGGTLTIITELGALWPCNFSPFVPPVNSTPDSMGIIYEPLVFINGFAKPDMRVETPWLASSYHWSNGNKTLTFTIRQGVRWSDGQPFTAADVVFTFNMLKKYPAMDLAGAWSTLTSVRQQGSDQVVMTLKPGSVPSFFNIADQTYIAPKHIWSKVANPLTYVDRHPVGTGPLLVQHCTAQNIIYVRNPHYWQAGRPYVGKVLFPAFTSNPPANLALAQDPGDWGGQFMPNINSYYIQRDPKYRHYWFPPASNNDVFMNLTEPLLSIRAVRQALSYAIDRQQVSVIGEYGYEPPASQTGVLLPAFERWYDKSQASQYDFYNYNPQKAIALLQKAGFKRGNSGTFQTKAGKPLSFSMIVIAGNTDSVACVKVIRDELLKVGITINIDAISADDFTSRLANGQYDLAWAGVGGGPSPYYELRNLLDSANTAPIGKPASTNFERWRSAQTDRLLDAFAATSNSAQQRQYLDQVQAIMLRDVPVIPVVQGVFWFQWSDRTFVGWPTPQNPYANPCPYCAPDWEVVLNNLHLR